MHLDPADVASLLIPIYIGDDVTDEDAFRAIAGRGIGILVAEEPPPGTARTASAAAYSLRDPSEVQEFLFRLAGCTKC
jgi:trehalose 6-phosphate phosphatase